MLQRFVKPVIFVLFFLAIVTCAIVTGRGESFTNPFILGRYADFATQSPLLSLLLLIVALPPALLVVLVPEPVAITLAVSDTGFWPGLLLSLWGLLAAGGSACLLTRALLHPALHRYMAVRRHEGRTLSRKAVLPIEFCLALTALCLTAQMPVVAAGFLLGLCGMRSKAFCLTAFPFAFARAAMQGLATCEAGLFDLIALGVLGTLLALAFLYWILLLFRRRLASERQKSAQAPVIQPVQRSRNRSLEDIDIEEIEAPAASVRDTLALDSVLLVCVTEQGDEDTASLVVSEARRLGLRVVVCSLVPEIPGTELPGFSGSVITGGFADRECVHDLDELFVRGFQEGAARVLAVRAVSPLIRKGLLEQAIALLPRHGLVLGSCASGFYLVGLCRSMGGRRYERGLLKGRTFESEIAFSLAGLAPHPGQLPQLPTSAALRPMVSVIVVADMNQGTLARTIAHALRAPWTECLVCVPPMASDLAEEATAAGAEVLALADLTGLGQAVQASRGKFLLFVRDGVQLPENFDEAVWQTMQQEKCRVGGFSLPRSVPAMQRTLRWLGTAIRPGTLSSPGFDQGLFLRREDYVLFGGFADRDETRAVTRLVARAAHVGRVIVHNARVQICEPDPELVKAAAARSGRSGQSGQSARGLVRSARERMEDFFARGRRKEASESAAAPDQAGDTAGSETGLGADSSRPSVAEEVERLLEPCDHCGRCTHVSPMLHKYKMDLADLPRHPLLAWHCFLCNACTEACHKGIDATGLVRLLRAEHVRRHGNRVARPGHTRTVTMARSLPVYTRSALPGKNLLLDADFCCAYPETAIALADRLKKAHVGVVLADCGARAADLGMEEVQKRRLEALRKAMDKQCVTGLYTLSPATHRYLVAMGVSVEPVYTLIKKLDLAPLNMDGYRMLVPCADRARRVFARALAPLLAGEVREIGVPCCGGGGEASVLEPGLAAALKKAVRQQVREERVLTTCTQCALTLTKAGIATDHPLSVLLGCRERARTGLGQLKALGQTIMAVAGLSLPADEAADRKGGLAARLLGRLGRKEEKAAAAAGKGTAAGDKTEAAPGLDIHMDLQRDTPLEAAQAQAQATGSRADEVLPDPEAKQGAGTALDKGEGTPQAAQLQESILPERPRPEAERLGGNGAVRLSSLRTQAERSEEANGAEKADNAVTAAEAASVTASERAPESAAELPAEPQVQAGLEEAARDEAHAQQPETSQADTVTEPAEALAAAEAAPLAASLAEPEVQDELKETDAATPAAADVPNEAQAEKGGKGAEASSAPEARDHGTDAEETSPVGSTPESAAGHSQSEHPQSEHSEQTKTGQAQSGAPEAGQAEAVEIGSDQSADQSAGQGAEGQAVSEPDSQTEAGLTEDGLNEGPLAETAQMQGPRLRAAVSLKDYKRQS